MIASGDGNHHMVFPLSRERDETPVFRRFFLIRGKKLHKIFTTFLRITGKILYDEYSRISGRIPGQLGP
jgi:hypothetical protein